MLTYSAFHAILGRLGASATPGTGLLDPLIRYNLPTSLALTDAKLRALTAPTKGSRVELADAVVPGLRARLGSTGNISFIVRKRVAGKSANITLGQFGTRFGLAEARKRARAVLSDIEAGGDPTAPSVRKARRAGTSGRDTIASLLPAYLAAKSHLRSVGEIERVFKRDILPEFGDRLADSVTRTEITRLIDAIATTSPYMALSALRYLSAFYSWALPRLERLPYNPCRDAGRPPPPKARDRVLTDRELMTLWRILDEEPLPWSAAIKFLILTGQRRGEVFEADRSEFDLMAKVWTIPAERAKNGKAHRVPLSRLALKVLATVPERSVSPRLFPAEGRVSSAASGFSKVQARLREGLEKEFGVVAYWRLHDIRRTVATGLQRLGVRVEVTEAVLNHISGTRSGIVGVYQRYDYADEKRAALDKWAREIERMIKADQIRLKSKN